MNRFGPHLAAFGAVTLWGVSFVATKAALVELSPVTLVFTRFALGTALLVILTVLRGGTAIPPRDAWPSLAGMGFVGIFVHQMLQAHGLTLTTAVHTGWLIGLIPIWSALLARMFLRERFGAVKSAGLALGFLGALLVVTRGTLSAGVLGLPTTRGDGLILASTLNWAIYTVLGHDTIRRLGALRAMAGTMLFGWALLVPFFLAERGWAEYPAVSAPTWAAVAFLGLACSGVAYVLWYQALRRLETSRVASFLYFEPLVTVTTAFLVLDETVTVSTAAGGLLVLAGVALVQRAPGGAALPMAAGRDGVSLRAVRVDSTEALALTAALDRDLLARYPDQAIYGLHPADVDDPGLRFLVAEIAGEAVGCAALRPLGPRAGEIKRMYVHPGFRGRGVARRLLQTLEAEARRRGYAVVRLESGTNQPEANGLYRSSGYVEIPCFGEYAGNPFSVCMEKRLR